MDRPLTLRRSAVYAALVICTHACGTNSEAPVAKAESRVPAQVSAVTVVPVDTITSTPALPCFSPDTGRIMFGRIEVASVDGDASGVAFSFQVTPSGMIGSVVDARGGVPPPQRLQGLKYDRARNSLHFWFASSTATRYIYDVRVSCNSLDGMARLFVTENSPGETVRASFPRNP